MSRCQACGTEPPGGSAFCTHCGTALGQEGQDGQDRSDTQSESAVPTEMEVEARRGAPGRPVTTPAVVPVKEASRQQGRGQPAPDTESEGQGVPAGQALVAEGAGRKARLVALHQDGRPRATLTASATRLEVGRRFGDACFAEDPYLSDRHCRFEGQGRGWRIVDLASQNGVYLRIRRPRPLQHGDRVLAGAEVFRFDVPDERDVELGPVRQDGVVLFGAPLHPVWGCLRLMTIGGVCRDVYYLHRVQTTIGREGADICFPQDEFMSRRHLVVELSEGRPRVRDLESANGTFVRVRREAPLADGDVLRIGRELVRFELTEGSELK